MRGGGPDLDLARPTAGSGAREALATRRPRPSDRPEAGPRKPTCQSYRPAGWARGATQPGPRHSLGCAFAQGQRCCAWGGSRVSLVAPRLRGRRLGARPERVPGLCVGIGKDRGLQGARLGILLLDAFPFAEMT